MSEQQNKISVKTKKLFIIGVMLIIMCMGFMLCSCNEDATSPVYSTENTDSIQTTTAQEVHVTETGFEPAHKHENKITLNAKWDCEFTEQTPNENAAKYWAAFQTQKNSAESASEVISLLSYVTSRDKKFIPGFIEEARYYIQDYNETGDTSSPSNAMNILTYGYLYTGHPIFLELKNSLGYMEIEKTIKRAETALKENDKIAAYEIINELPEHYFYILESTRILTILNHMDDTYYYLILGPAAGNQYIVHFKIDGTYERVKMNQNGIYDSGEYTYEITQPWDLSFAGLQFINRGFDYYWLEYDSNYNAKEYIMTKDTDGRAKEQFAQITNAALEETTPSNDIIQGPMIDALTKNKWQNADGMYYEFRPDGTGTVHYISTGFSYGLTYIVNPENENEIYILEEDNPYDYAWIYMPATETFQQRITAFNENTGSAETFYMDIYKYNG